MLLSDYGLFLNLLSEATVRLNRVSESPPQEAMVALADQGSFQVGFFGSL